MEASIEQGAPSPGQPEETSPPPAPISEPAPPASSEDARGALQAAAQSFASSVDEAIAAGVPPMEAVMIVQGVLANPQASAPPTAVAENPYSEPVSAEAQAAALGGEASVETAPPIEGVEGEAAAAAEPETPA